MAVARASGPSRQELFTLHSIISRHCGCPPGPLRAQVRPCEACELTSTQFSILRLVFYRRHADALHRGEALQPPRWQDA